MEEYSSSGRKPVMKDYIFSYKTKIPNSDSNHVMRALYLSAAFSVAALAVSIGVENLVMKAVKHQKPKTAAWFENRVQKSRDDYCSNKMEREPIVLDDCIHNRVK